MAARNPDIKPNSIDGPMFHLRGLLASSMMASWPQLAETMISIYREVNLRMAIGQRSDSFWQRVPRSCVPHPLARARPVSDARDVSYSRVRSFAVFSSTSRGSLTLKLAYPSSLLFSLFSPLSLSLLERHARGAPRRCCPRRPTFVPIERVCSPVTVR